MKKVLIMIILAMSFLVIASPVMATSSSYYGASNPKTIGASVNVNFWGPPGYWDLTNNASIPDGVTVTSITEAWTSSYPNTGLQVALFKADGNGWYVASGNPVSGAVGTLVKQNWSTRCAAKVNCYITPTLTIWWTTPTTSTESVTQGVTTLLSNGSSETSISADPNKVNK